MVGCVRFVHQVATRAQQRDERGDEIAIQEVRYDDAIENGGTEWKRSGVADDAEYCARSAHRGAHRDLREIDECDAMSLLRQRSRVTSCSSSDIAYQRPARQHGIAFDDPRRRLLVFGAARRITSVPVRT